MVHHPNMKWRPFWASHVGALKGCLDFLGIRMSDAWLMGGIGHAFVLHISADVSAAGPTAWNTEMMRLLGGNLGYHVDGIFAWKSESRFADKQKLAWETVKRALEQGVPCYGWELGLAEYYVLNGYNDYGYMYSGIGTSSHLFDLSPDRKLDLQRGMFTDQLREELVRRGIMCSAHVQIEVRFGCWIIRDVERGCDYSVLEDRSDRLMFHGDYETSQGFKSWDALGSSAIGLLEVYTVESAYTSNDDAVVKEALQFALDFAQNHCNWVRPGYHSGLDGYEVWKNALDHRTANAFGMAYNAAVWQECRMLAAQFLEEAASRLGGQAAGLLREASQWYEEVAGALKAITEQFPFHQRQPERMGDVEAVTQASRAISLAQEAERRGLHKLQQIVNLLETR